MRTGPGITAVNRDRLLGELRGFGRIPIQHFLTSRHQGFHQSSLTDQLLFAGLEGPAKLMNGLFQVSRVFRRETCQ